MNRIIYLDLDETLFHTIIGDFPNLGHSFRLGGYDYSTMLRPQAHELVALAKKYGRVGVLTNSTRDYAGYLINHFGFDVEQELIFTRHDYCDYISGGWMSGERQVSLRQGEDRTAILIDNLYRSDPGARIKTEWIGCGLGRLIRVPGYYGNNEDEVIDLDLIEQHIKDLINQEI